MARMLTEFKEEPGQRYKLAENVENVQIFPSVGFSSGGKMAALIAPFS